MGDLMLTHHESILRGLDLRAMGRTPVAEYNAGHKARAHAARIGGEVTLGPCGFDVWAPATPPPPPVESEQLSLGALAPLAPAIPGQAELGCDGCAEIERCEVIAYGLGGFPFRCGRDTGHRGECRFA
jgi:hypothetical protein